MIQKKLNFLLLYNNRRSHILSLLILFLVLVVFGLLFYVLLGSLLTNNNNNIDGFLNPDINTYPFMIKNLMYQHGYFFDWHMGSATYLFPDLFFLYVLRHFFSDTYTLIIFNALFQTIFFCIITIVLFKTIVNTSSGIRLGILTILTYLTIILIKKFYGNFYGHNAYLSTMFGIGFHFGAALIVLTSLFIMIKILSNNQLYLKYIFIIYNGDFRSIILYLLYFPNAGNNLCLLFF